MNDEKVNEAQNLASQSGKADQDITSVLAEIRERRTTLYKGTVYRLDPLIVGRMKSDLDTLLSIIDNLQPGDKVESADDRREILASLERAQQARNAVARAALELSRAARPLSNFCYNVGQRREDWGRTHADVKRFDAADNALHELEAVKLIKDVPITQAGVSPQADNSQNVPDAGFCSHQPESNSELNSGEQSADRCVKCGARAGLDFHDKECPDGRGKRAYAHAADDEGSK